MTSVEFKDCAEKERVREELWKPLIEKVFEKNKNIKYLTLPGSGCFELDKFLNLKLLRIENTVSVEYKQDFLDAIRSFYAKKVGFSGLLKIKDCIYHCKFEEIIKDRTFIERHFPFDIINFDAYGSPFVFNQEDESIIFNIIDDIINNHRSYEKDLYIIVTLRLSTSKSLADTVSKIKSEILDPILIEAENTDLDTWLNKKQNKEDWIKIFSIIFHTLSSSQRGIEIVLYSQPYTYIGSSVQKKARMLSYILKIRYNVERSINVNYQKSRKKKLLNSSVDLIKSSVWIN